MIAFADYWSRHVACLRAVLPRAIHDHVPLREGPTVTTLPRRACTAEISQWRRALHWYERLSRMYISALNLYTQPANCARPSAQRRPSPSRARLAWTGRGAQRNMVCVIIRVLELGADCCRYRHDQMHLLRLLPGGMPSGRYRGECVYVF